MRKFKLINAIGAEFDLMRRDAFFSSPAGLGISRSPDIIQMEDYFFPVQDHAAQRQISGEMVFKGYAEYTEFADFLTENLVLAYKPPDKAQWEYRECRLITLEKGEFNGDFLYSQIIFVAVSPWYRSRVYELAAEERTGGIIFDESVFPLTFSDTATGEINISNSGKDSALCKITVFGAAENPHWVLRQGGETLQTGTVNVSLAEGERLVCDGWVTSAGIWKYTAAGAENVYQQSDFATARFLDIPAGNSSITITHSGETPLSAIVEVREIV